MEHIIIGLVACFASLLTFFSGFGLGTLLLPAFILFFPSEIAIALTAIVHLLNNLFKFSLVGKFLNKYVLIRFGITAIVGAFFGAVFLRYLSESEPICSYTFSGTEFYVQPVSLVIAVLMLFFALFEIVPALKKIEFGKNALIPGGALSGFFGGLSGHQGALRSAFLIKFGLSKEQFISTGIAIACLIDFTRIGTYFLNNHQLDIGGNKAILLTATLSAFLGAYLGRQLLKKVTIDFVQYIVATLLILMAVALGMGII